MGKLIKALAKGIASGAILAITIWIVASFAEVNVGNAGHNPHYNRYNLFVMVADYPEII